ncbi:xanthine dehydrogenase family protein subunit M [soil metagenome]
MLLSQRFKKGIRLPAARFERPASIGEATALLAAGGWSLLAGGTDVYPAQVGRPMTVPLIDITRIAALRGITRQPATDNPSREGWTFGATTTWSDVQRADLPPLFDALRQAAHEVGGVQIQNTGTIAGNLCNASPAADGTPVWLALGAHVLLQSADGDRSVPVEDFVLGSRRTARSSHELVTGLHVPPRSARARSAFLKLGGRRYLTISMTMVAVMIDADEAGSITAAGIAVGSCSARALRLPMLERRLIGMACASLADVVIEPADLAPLTPIDDLRATAGYRLDATATLLRRALASLNTPSPAPSP